MKKTIVIVLHLVFWLLFVIGLMIVNGTPDNYTVKDIIALILIQLWALSSFYSFYMYLFPKILGRKKIARFIVYSFITGLIISGIIKTVTIILYGFSTPSEDIVSIIIGALITIIFGQFGTMLRAFVDWFKNLKKTAALEKQALETEIAFLRSQINPHFMFNTLANIDTLIFENQKMASKSLLKLSELFRYMVYETNKDRVLLKDEINYLNSYIDLQKLRLNNNESIRFQIQGDPGDTVIAPMLFVPLVENVFKHCDNKESPNAINFKTEIINGNIRFRTVNQYSNRAIKALDKGVGLNILKKRLELIYPGRHKLEITKSGNIFSVNLELEDYAN